MLSEEHLLLLVFSYKGELCVVILKMCIEMIK